MIIQVSLEDESGEEYIDGDAYIVFKEDLIEDGLDYCHFKLTGKTLNFDEDIQNFFGGDMLFACKYKNIDDASFETNNVIYIQDNVLYIQHPDIHISWEITPEAGNDTKRILEEYIKREEARKTGEELSIMKNEYNKRENFPLNYDTLGVVGSFLSGTKGPLNRQISEQKKKAGISLEPRPRKAKSRKTRKTRKL